MKKEYSRPFVEIVDFVALERIATDVRSEHEARDAGAFEGVGNSSATIPDGGITPSPTAGVGDW